MFKIERDAHRANYTCISNAMLRDGRLSLAARGFFAVVLSLPSEWDFSVSGMAQFVGINKDTVLRYIRELERLGYAVSDSKRECGRYSRKHYCFYETAAEITAPAAEISSPAVAENTAPVTEDTAAAEAETAADRAAPRSSSEINTELSNTEKENTSYVDPIDEQRFIFLDRQINACALREEFGEQYIDRVVEVIRDCLKAKSRTISGGSVDNAELVRVFGAVNGDDVRKAIKALDGKQFDSFSGYFGSVLFNQIKSRLEQPPKPSHQDSGSSSLDLSDIDREVLAKYHRGIAEMKKQREK